MRQLSEEGRKLVAEAAARYGFSEEAVLTLLTAVSAGGGSQAQFNHPDFGGFGQWQRGGMIMIGDMFNHGLKANVAGLCADLSNAIAVSPLWKPEPAASATSFSFAFAGGAGWPAELGAPSSSGAQNDLAYAFFPATRRLAIRRGGELKIYDAGPHQISGVSQQQGGDQTLTFTSQLGVVRAADLAPVLPASPRPDVAPPRMASAEPVAVAAAPDPIPPARAPAETPVVTLAPGPKPAPTSISQPAFAVSEDIFGMLERLADLRQKGVLTEEEFARKKTELLDRI